MFAVASIWGKLLGSTARGKSSGAQILTLPIISFRNLGHVPHTPTLSGFPQIFTMICCRVVFIQDFAHNIWSADTGSTPSFPKRRSASHSDLPCNISIVHITLGLQERSTTEALASSWLCSPWQPIYVLFACSLSVPSYPLLTSPEDVEEHLLSHNWSLAP